MEDSHVFSAPTGEVVKPLNLEVAFSSKEESMAPVQRLTWNLDDSSASESLPGAESSSLMIEEVEMSDCD